MAALISPHVTEPAISLTGSAARRVAAIAERQAKPAILRLSVDGGGCAGFTYRFEEHSLGVGRVRRGEYRTEDEIAKWRERDPIVIHTEHLVSQDVATAAECEAVEESARAEVEAALEFARNSPYPEPAALHEDMWANPIPAD